MRGGALPPALLCAALGLALGFAPRRAWPVSLAILVAVAVGASWLKIPPAWIDGVFAGCWISVVLAAASVHLPGGMGRNTALALSANTGLWCGAVIAAAGTQVDLIEALPLALLCLPAGWLVGRGWGVAVKVVSSWLIAIALLAAFLPVTTPTPGYAPDHMD